jgi:hypothetical protein
MKKRLPAISAVVLLVFACTPEGSWDQILSHQDLAEKGLIWERRVPIDIDNATGAVDLQDVPVPIRLTASSFDLDSTAAGGAYLRFTAADGVTDLPHEVETWREPPSGDSLVWVKVPFVAANSPATRIWLYYKNRNPRPADNAAAVWTDSYEAVWHLGDAAGGNAFHDSTGHGRDGTSSGGYARPARTAGGAFGAAAAYTLPSDGIAVSDVAGSLLAGPFTLTFWAKDGGFATGSRLLSNEALDLWLRQNPGGKLSFQVNLTGTNFLKEFVNPIPDGVIHRYDVTWTGVLHVDDVKFYRDGVVQNIVASQNNGSGTVATNNDGLLVLGNWVSETPTRAFKGNIDEVRIAATVRSPQWIQAQYNLESAGAVTIGQAEVVQY